jgi:sugar/nucleoside kinase (ribokinase family)
MTVKKVAVPSVVGTGLIVLDVTVSSATPVPAHPVWTGGTCGNVLAILSFLGWQSHAFGRIGNDAAGTCLVRDLLDSGVDAASLDREPAGTPIILHRVSLNRRGEVRHGYSFDCPQCQHRYPSFRPVLVSRAEALTNAVETPTVFFFDRASRGILDMAAAARRRGATVFFEPSASGEEKQFVEAYELSDVVKYAHNRRPKFGPWLERAASERRAPLEVETRGSDGLVFRLQRDRRWRTREATPVATLRDASGAGDWLTAGFLYAAARQGPIADVLADPDSVHAALGVGQALAAYSCQFEGPRGAMYGCEVEATTQMLSGVDARARRRLTSEPKRPALRMTLTGVCSACVSAAKKGRRDRTGVVASVKG